MYKLPNYFVHVAVVVACERRRISGGRFSSPKRPPEIRLRSQATVVVDAN